METTTKFGIDRCYLMAIFHEILLANKAEIKSKYDNFTEYLSSQINRKVSSDEELNFMKATLAFIESDIGTKARIEMLDYILNLEFLTEDIVENKTQN